ncbi:MAG: helix-turn-helix transcriptional regulator [Clostridia bacterium]|nr:helix-turn-helix transcriptional regulator [Clostridia bacterium]
MSEFKTWKEVRKTLHFTPEEEEEMRLEREIIFATMKAREKSKLTQTELAKKSGIKQPNIAKLENYQRSPQVSTLLKLLYSMGYTLKVVPLEESKSE